MQSSRKGYLYFSLFFTISVSQAGAYSQNNPQAKRITPKDGFNSLITSDHVEAIYQRLVEYHWVPETGLFLSFPDSGDTSLSQQASTYEQGAAGLLALRVGDLARAQRIFQFFKQAWQQSIAEEKERQGAHGLVNFYNADFGGEGIEKTIHVGPNAWVALFAARLANTTQDREPLQWAMDVAYWVTHCVPHEEGGVAMGPIDGSDGTPWPKLYSTENNLSYYALLAELLRSSQLDAGERAWIGQEKQGVENWLVNKAFDRTTYTMNRGINMQGPDRMQALDTVSWLMAALGPERLRTRGVDPDRLMRMAQAEFEVQIGGLRGVDAVDEAEARVTFAQQEHNSEGHLSRRSDDRHRMIWYEGLGQYINSLSLMVDYHQRAGRFERAQEYAEKAAFLSRQFDLAALASAPKGTAYPYATPGKFFHDGWWVPAGNAKGPAASLIAATWRCFAGLGLDPLSGREIGHVRPVRVFVPPNIASKHQQPAIVYGTSDDMTDRAWRLLQSGQRDQAMEQAQATIRQWTPWARRLEDKKEREVGHLVNYDGTPALQKQIFSYWALNDVAAAYFILGKTFDQKGDYAHAAKAFREIVLNFPLAQIWDPQGWFWAPVESVKEEFVDADPKHYGDVAPDMLAASSELGKHPN